MIRLYNIFCKQNLINIYNITAKELFEKSLDEININEIPCPKCASKEPQWIIHAYYCRDLISFENDEPVCYKVNVPRYICFSCDGTHALLPEIAVPYTSYSLVFILAVLKDRLIYKTKITQLLNKYKISTGVYCRWLDLYKENIILWNKIIFEDVKNNDTKTCKEEFNTELDPITFLLEFPFEGVSGISYYLWKSCGLSFMQRSSHKEKVHILIRQQLSIPFSPFYHIRC
jgi:hypothetical protein